MFRYFTTRDSQSLSPLIRKKKQRIKETPEIEKIKEIPAFKEHERDTNLKEFGVLEASIWQ